MTKSLALVRALRQAHPNVGISVRLREPDRGHGAGGVRAAAREAGADGVLCVDYPADEDGELTGALARQGLDFVPLLAPTSTAARIDVAAKVASGFIYYVSLTGITGTALADMEEPRAKVEAIRKRTGGKYRSPSASASGRRAPRARSRTSPTASSSAARPSRWSRRRSPRRRIRCRSWRRSFARCATRSTAARAPARRAGVRLFSDVL